MHTLTSKRVTKFSRDFGFEGPKAEQFERYVAANYLHQYLRDDVHMIERTLMSGGNDEGIDIAAVIVNGVIVFEPDEIDDLIFEQALNSVKVVFMQAKTSESYNSKLIAKFLHGVESVTHRAMSPNEINLPPRLTDLAALIDHIAENGDMFKDSRVPCELYYVTTSSHDGRDALSELQVQQALNRIRQIGVYTEDLELRAHGHEEIAAKQKERHGPQNVRFNFEKHQAIPATERVNEAYIGLILASELMNLLKDDTGEIRPGIFDDNVRLDLGPENEVNERISGTLKSAKRAQFPFLNNGLTIVASDLRNTGGRFSISGYQIVNGGQTSHQLIRWSRTADVIDSPELMSNLWIPIKIVSSSDPTVRTEIAVATNLQTAIGSSDIQASSQVAKDVEEFFEQSGVDGLRYERQSRGAPIDFARTRVVTTPELNRAVAATLFGDSARAIGSSKELEREDSYVWDEYPVEAYYYAAWIIYRIDRYFGRTPTMTTLKAAKYHIAMMVSALVNPNLMPLFDETDAIRVGRTLKTSHNLNFKVSGASRSTDIENSIEAAMAFAAKEFAAPLSQGRSLRKDDVRSRRSQDNLRQMVKAPITSSVSGPF